jgi:xanthine/uracil permease
MPVECIPFEWRIMNLSTDTKRSSLLVVTAFACFVARWPGHRPWAAGGVFGVLAGVVVSYIIIMFLCAMVGAAYERLSTVILPEPEHPGSARHRLETDEVTIVTCATLLIVSILELMGDAGVFEGLGQGAE